MSKSELKKESHAQDGGATTSIIIVKT